MQMPPLWTGVAGQGNQKIYSLGGKWYPAGTTLQSGYKIVGDDGKGTLKMSWNGLPVNVAMQGATIQPYTPPQTFNQTPAWMGGGAMSTQEEEMAGMYNPYSDPTLVLQEQENRKYNDMIMLKINQIKNKYPNLELTDMEGNFR